VLTAIVVAFPAAAPIVDPWRERTCLDRPSIGIPAHVTVVFPFIPAEEIGDETLALLQASFAAVPAFSVSFRHTARFPTTLYLAPEPPDPFVALTEAIVARWPEYPPYEGAFESIVPHLTVAHGDAALLAEADADVSSGLPMDGVIREVALLEEIDPGWVRWGTRATFPLG
jgi:2'-5' RNA ligase